MELFTREFLGTAEFPMAVMLANKHSLFQHRVDFLCDVLAVLKEQ